MTFNPHVSWCSNRNIDEGRHDEYMPCCFTGVGSAIPIDPDAGYDKAQINVYATRVAHSDALAPGTVPGRSAFDGIQLAIESHRSGNAWDEQEFRLTSHAARSLAAALVRAADIEQGLTR